MVSSVLSALIGSECSLTLNSESGSIDLQTKVSDSGTYSSSFDDGDNDVESRKPRTFDSFSTVRVKNPVNRKRNDFSIGFASVDASLPRNIEYVDRKEAIRRILWTMAISFIVGLVLGIGIMKGVQSKKSNDQQINFSNQVSFSPSSSPSIVLTETSFQPSIQSIKSATPVPSTNTNFPSVKPSRSQSTKTNSPSMIPSTSPSEGK